MQIRDCAPNKRCFIINNRNIRRQKCGQGLFKLKPTSWGVKLSFTNNYNYNILFFFISPIYLFALKPLRKSSDLKKKLCSS